MKSEVKFEVTVIKRTGKCVMEYEEGDTFLLEGMNTPEKPFCGASFHALFPGILSMRFGAEFPFSEKKNTLTVTCPDHGYITYQLKCINN